jgi:hypothetical protein
MKNYLILFAISLIIICCNNMAPKETATSTLNVLEFEKKAGDYVNKEVTLEGLVSHTCKEGGKKMFIMDPKCDSITVKIITENVFDKSLEGSNVLISGIVRELRVDEAYIKNMEKETSENSTIDREAGMKHTPKELSNENTTQNSVTANLRNELKKCGKDHLSFYSVECKKLEVKK